MKPQDFLTQVLQSPEYSIPIEANYSINMSNLEEIGAKLFRNRNIISDQKLLIRYELINRLKDEVFLATSINLPGESVATGRVGFTGDNTIYGGLLSAPVLRGRQNLNNLDITFIETNDSLLDYFLRPWVVAASQFGLFSRRKNSPQNLKTEIMVTFFSKKTKNNDTTPAERKTLVFYDAVPVEVGGYEAAYGKSVGVRTTKTSWIYSYYQVK